MRVYTVHECSLLVADAFKKDYIFRNITVRGMVSNLHVHFSGMVFFSLVDEEFRILCKIRKMGSTFRGRNLKNGTEVSISGSFIYDKNNGKPLIIVERVLAVSESPITIRLAQLRSELEERGYFDSQRKKKLPKYPFKIGIITSKSGAAVYDIIKTGLLRNNSISYSIYNTSVQGADTAENIANMIRVANNDEPRSDVLIVARGGGAEEDLKVFNELILLEAAHASEIPIISAVGHETDITLLDLVADVRASTPTQAAEIAVPNKQDIEKQILKFIRTMMVYTDYSLQAKKDQFFYYIKMFGTVMDAKDIDSAREMVFLMWLLLHKQMARVLGVRKMEVAENLLRLNEYN